MYNEKKQNFTQGVIALIISQIIVKILGLIYRLYLTNKDGFGDEGNAIYGGGFQIYALLLILSSFGIPNALSKLISEKLSIGDEKNADKIFKVAFLIFSLLGFLCAFFLFIGAEYISNEILQIPETAASLKILAPSILFVTIMSIFRGYFNARNNMKAMAKSQSIEQIFKAIFTISIVEVISYCSIGNSRTQLMATGANLATTLATMVSCVYLYMYYKKNRSKKILSNNYNVKSIKAILKDIIIIAMPITLGVFLGGLNKTIDSITVVRELKNFMEKEKAKIQYGVLSGKIDTLISLPLSFNMALNANIVPTIASAKARNNIKEIKGKIKLAFFITVIIALPYTIIMILFADNILKILFPNASGGSFILKVSALSIIFTMINQTINGILQGMGKNITPVISISIGVIIKLIINLTLVKVNPEYFLFGGIAGAALGTVLCHVCAMGINLWRLKNIENTELNEEVTKQPCANGFGRMP